MSRNPERVSGHHARHNECVSFQTIERAIASTAHTVFPGNPVGGCHLPESYGVAIAGARRPEGPPAASSDPPCRSAAATRGSVSGLPSPLVAGIERQQVSTGTSAIVGGDVQGRSATVQWRSKADHGFREDRDHKRGRRWWPAPAGGDISIGFTGQVEDQKSVCHHAFACGWRVDGPHRHCK